MNRWIRYIRAVSNLYDSETVRKILINNPDTPGKALREHYSSKKDVVIDNLEQENRKLRDRIKELEDSPHPKKKYWNNRPDKAKVTYQRPIYQGNGEFENHDIDVRQFITPNTYEIQEKIKGLEVEDPLQINEAAVDIYEKAQENYDYKYDSKDLDHTEYWKFPYETLHDQCGDCEDHANKIVSFLIAAGVPSWRVRNVCGIINRGTGGHSTVYVLDDSLETWRHINSTSTTFHDSLTDYPEYGDESDGIGIDPDRTWFSFTDKHAWSDFTTNNSTNLNDAKHINNIKVRRK